MKRRDLIKRLSKHARATGHELVLDEGGKHTKVTIGDRQTTVPRHGEINELTARGILRQMGVEK